MRLIPTHRVPEGSRLGRDVASGNPDGLPLMCAGVELDEHHRELLIGAGIGAVWVDDELSQGWSPSS